MKRTTVILLSCLVITVLSVMWQQRTMPEDTNRKPLSLPGSAEFSKIAAIANQSVSQAGLKWGQPVRVEWQNVHGRYIVFYLTPESERGILGSRAVHVETNGKVWLVPRG